MFCMKCGNQIDDNSTFCRHCGQRLSGNPQTAAPINVVVQESGFIPNNAASLWSYYLGLFSMLFFPLAIISFICGIKGLKNAKNYPTKGGTVHSIVGIIASLFTMAVYAFFIFCLIASN